MVCMVTCCSCGSDLKMNIFYKEKVMCSVKMYKQESDALSVLEFVPECCVSLSVTSWKEAALAKFMKSPLKAWSVSRGALCGCQHLYLEISLTNLYDFTPGYGTTIFPAADIKYNDPCPLNQDCL
ncbi:hypothetical protein NC652_006890 [Populus alba x Populus x berolinensis]|nr:hypothetical protein NC652_006890 [Populus alba x Populus x berolinensis]